MVDEPSWLVNNSWVIFFIGRRQVNWFGCSAKGLILIMPQIDAIVRFSTWLSEDSLRNFPSWHIAICFIVVNRSRKQYPEQQQHPPPKKKNPSK